MSEHLTREQLIEQMARAQFDAQDAFYPTPDEWDHMGTRERAEWLAIVGSTLPVIVKAVTDRMRALHEPVEVEPSDTICGPCSFLLPNGRYFGKVEEYPCPTVRLCDEIDADLGVER